MGGRLALQCQHKEGGWAGTRLSTTAVSLTPRSFCWASASHSENTQAVTQLCSWGHLFLKRCYVFSYVFVKKHFSGTKIFPLKKQTALAWTAMMTFMTLKLTELLFKTKNPKVRKFHVTWNTLLLTSNSSLWWHSIACLNYCSILDLVRFSILESAYGLQILPCRNVNENLDLSFSAWVSILYWKTSSRIKISIKSEIIFKIYRNTFLCIFSKNTYFIIRNKILKAKQLKNQHHHNLYSRWSIFPWFINPCFVAWFWGN